MQTGRDKCIRIAMSHEDNPFIVSPAYTTFEVTNNKCLPEYFFMLFLSKEMDRLGWFCSDGSIRSNLDWDVYCDFELELPPIEVQRKYVAVYEAMLANQRSYERGLEDLKLVCDGMLEHIKNSVETKVKLGDVFDEIDERNTDLVYTTAYGLNIQKQFIVSSASSDDLSRYKIVRPNQFAYSSMQTGRDKCIRISLATGAEAVIVSPAYSVLEVSSKDVVPEYLMMWFSRSESDRLGWFCSDGSIRANLDLPRFFEFEIPLPDIKVQQAIANLYKAYRQRCEINKRLKAQLKDLCPILIKGSIDEARTS